jgi:hypothetical protein
LRGHMQWGPSCCDNRVKRFNPQPLALGYSALTMHEGGAFLEAQPPSTVALGIKFPAHWGHIQTVAPMLQNSV